MQDPVNEPVAAPKEPVKESVNPLSLGVEDLARMLSAVGGRKVTAEQVQRDLDAGAPVLPTGRVNLVHYTAWLLREVQSA